MNTRLMHNAFSLPHPLKNQCQATVARFASGWAQA